MADEKTTAAAAEQETQASTQQTAQQPRANFPELLNMCNGLLHNLFYKLPKPKSKELFTEVKKGGSPVLGNITVGDKITLKLKLTLDYTEFVGPGFNFDIFRTALKGLLERINTTLRLKADLGLRTNQQGGVLVGFAGTVTKDEQLNALMMVVDMGQKDEIILRLSFVNPAQFQQQ
ncbi:hypothetical protein QSV34_14465 [Porticoccus sp. W117]|uniref:hypothetical protein n=1 Tax=Porticoccus sp. W117 TaxID=3054777 RepID=UPI00259773DD|nr:hypothetical protein [Porticoccus sp. W117]MDM3872553.1 hypothetical protein [Porticoccus sp. W117]